MKQWEYKWKEMLMEEEYLPDEVEAGVETALNQIRQGKVVQNNCQHRKKRNVAVAAAMVVLLLGTTTYAATTKWGLLDYLTKRESNLDKNKVEKLVNTEVPQTVDAKEDALVNFGIRQVLCDNNLVMLEVEAVPSDPEHYLLAPFDSDADAPVSDLAIDGVKEGTVGEYAKSQGKEIVYVNAYASADGSSVNFVSEPDGTMLIVNSFEKGTDAKTVSMNCITQYHLEGEDVIKQNIAFDVKDDSKNQAFVYKPEKTVAFDDLPEVTFDRMEVSRTDLTTQITFYSKLKETTEDNPTIWYRLYKEDGTELELVQGGYGGYDEMNEDEEYAITELYKTDQLPDTLMVEAYDCMEKTIYGRFRVQLSK